MVFREKAFGFISSRDLCQRLYVIIITILYLFYYFILLSFIAFAQAVLNAEIFLLGKLQPVAKGQEDALYA